MLIDTRTEGNATLLSLSGELDAHNLDEFRSKIEAVIQSGCSRLCFNLANLRFINSSAIGCFVEVYRDLKREGGELVLSQPSKFLQTTIKTLGLDRLFTIYADDEDAIKHLTGEGDPGAAAGVDEVPVDPTLLGSTEMEFRFPESESAVALGRILHIWKDGISFRYPDDPDKMRIDPDELTFGRKLRFRFQQPFIDKEHVFDLEGEIAYALDQDDGSIKFHVRYTGISDADLALIEDFVKAKDLVLPYLPKQDD
ncbi:MAG: STAS domain-containing protein [Planctomycetota bacterium]|jgi:anti-anti-sigma factor